MLVLFSSELLPLLLLPTDDDFAADPRIDSLRDKIYCVEDARYTKEYMEADKRSIGNGVTIEFNDGSKLDEIAMDYPVGHARRRDEAIPLIAAKLEKHLDGHFDDNKKKQLLELLTDHEKLTKMPAHEFVDVSSFEWKVDRKRISCTDVETALPLFLSPLLFFFSFGSRTKLDAHLLAFSNSGLEVFLLADYLLFFGFLVISLFLNT